MVSQAIHEYCFTGRQDNRPGFVGKNYRGQPDEPVKMAIVLRQVRQLLNNSRPLCAHRNQRSSLGRVHLRRGKNRALSTAARKFKVLENISPSYCPSEHFRGDSVDEE
jgi:hypothetical protein